MSAVFGALGLGRVPGLWHVPFVFVSGLLASRLFHGEIEKEKPVEPVHGPQPPGRKEQAPYCHPSPLINVVGQDEKAVHAPILSDVYLNPALNPAGYKALRELSRPHRSIRGVADGAPTGDPMRLTGQGHNFSAARPRRPTCRIASARGTRSPAHPRTGCP